MFSKLTLITLQILSQKLGIGRTLWLSIYKDDYQEPRGYVWEPPVPSFGTKIGPQLSQN